MGQKQSSLGRLLRQQDSSVRERDEELRKRLGVDLHGWTSASGLSTPSSDQEEIKTQSIVVSSTPVSPPVFVRQCSVCCKKLPKHMYSAKQWKKGDTDRICKGCVCVYCNKREGRTREHLLPKCVGGKLTVRACLKCNQKRGNDGQFGPFLSFIKTNPLTWDKALMESGGIQNKEMMEYISDHNLSYLSLKALLHARQCS